MITNKKPEFHIDLASLHDADARVVTQRMHDNDFAIVVNARPITRVDRVPVEQWLINEGIIYDRVLYD